MVRFMKGGMLAALIGLVALWGVSAQAEDTGPQSTVEAGVKALTQTLDDYGLNDPEQVPDAFYQSLDQAMSPYIDFRYISARVMGKYFRAASPQQRSKFAEVFKNTLIKTMGKGLITFDYKVIRLLPDNTPRRYDDQDTVNMEVVAQDGTIYPMTFTLRKSKKSAQWHIINVIVNGINLGLTFNSQFDQAMRDNRRDFDATIAGWNPKVDVSKSQEDGQ